MVAVFHCSLCYVFQLRRCLPVTILLDMLLLLLIRCAAPDACLLSSMPAFRLLATPLPITCSLAGGAMRPASALMFRRYSSPSLRLIIISPRRYFRYYDEFFICFIRCRFYDILHMLPYFEPCRYFAVAAYVLLRRLIFLPPIFTLPLFR